MKCLHPPSSFFKIYGFSTTTPYLLALAIFKFFMYFCFWLCWVFVAARAFLTVESGGCSLAVVHRLSTAVASLVPEHRLEGAWASVAVACGLSS